PAASHCRSRRPPSGRSILRRRCWSSAKRAESPPALPASRSRTFRFVWIRVPRFWHRSLETFTRTRSSCWASGVSMLEPDQTTFIILSFEGPDVYSQAGGLGVRVKELSRALAERGYETHLFFVGVPTLPAGESALDGRLRLHRWSQWISQYR